MDPLGALRDEPLEVEGGSDGPPVGRAPDVVHVGYLGIEHLLVPPEEGQPPCVVVLLRGALGEPARDKVVVGEDGRHVGPQGNPPRARQRGAVNDKVWGLLASRHQRVGEDQPPLGVRVADLRREAVAGRQHVARAEGPPRDGILDGADEHPQVHVEALAHDHVGEAKDLPPPPHVLLHLPHGRGGLDVQPPGVEAHALAHERHLLAPAPGAPPHLDQPGCVLGIRGAAHGVHLGVVLLEEAVPLDRRHLGAVQLAQRLGRRLQGGGAHVLCGGGHQVSDQEGGLRRGRHVGPVGALGPHDRREPGLVGPLAALALALVAVKRVAPQRVPQRRLVRRGPPEG
mmetsp:Transcript_5854/g.15008  ORF Transcript_5854/g.15008 Transcript_5854/m.15008 type:complete len:342 (+) Transcript_5854:382-1407(+)